MSVRAIANAEKELGHLEAKLGALMLVTAMVVSYGRHKSRRPVFNVQRSAAVESSAWKDHALGQFVP